jgi:hypothetical protein
MKQLTTILVFALVCSFASGQAANQVFPTDSTHGNENVYLTGQKEAGIYQGVAGFVFTTSHDAATFYLQGCYNTNAWYNIDTVTASGATAVNQFLYQTPPKFKYYRLYGDGSAGDTCIISNARYIIKY